MNLWENTPGLCEKIPTLEYYPAKNKKSDAAIVIFPGGGYAGLAPHEGQGYAEFLNDFGYDAFVCNYRVKPHAFPLPLLDARRAVRTVRYNADKYGINKSKIAVMGSSAGGNLAALASTYTLPLEYEGADEIDNENFLPNAQILCYPLISLVHPEAMHKDATIALLADRLDLAPALSPELNVTKSTPPAFIWQTAEDSIVSVLNSYIYASALKKQDVPVEMHIFPFGPHGMGTAEDNPNVSQWTGLLNNWLDLIFGK